MRWIERHARRLARDARALGLPELDPEVARRALCELAEEAFGGGDGVVRLEARLGAEGRLRLVGRPRALGREPAHWRAGLALEPHPGPDRWCGVKRCGCAAVEAAREHARARGLDEVLLFDRDGFLVEGARANLLWCDAAGRLATPPPERGGVRGIALELLRERLPEIAAADLHRDALPSLRELVAVNAVRGARAITSVDAAPVGDGLAGAWAARLDEILRSD